MDLLDSGNAISVFVSHSWARSSEHYGKLVPLLDLTLGKCWTNISIPRDSAVALWNDSHEALRAAQATLFTRLSLFDKKLAELRTQLCNIREPAQCQAELWRLQVLLTKGSTRFPPTISQKELDQIQKDVAVLKAKLNSFPKVPSNASTESDLRRRILELEARRDRVKKKRITSLNAKHLVDIKWLFNVESAEHPFPSKVAHDAAKPMTRYLAEEIYNSLYSADIVFFIVDPAVQYAMWMEYELQTAVKQHKPIIAVIPATVDTRCLQCSIKRYFRGQLPLECQPADLKRTIDLLIWRSSR